MNPPLVDVLEGRAKWCALYGEAFRILRDLPTASVDAVITDPPYSSGGFTRADRSDPAINKYVQHGTKIERPDFAGDNRDQRAYLTWCTLWMAECLRVAKPGAPVCIFTDWRQLPTTTDALQCGGWVWRGIVPWDKTEASRPQLGRFSSQCEYVVWGSAGPLPERPELGALRGLIRQAVERDDKPHITGKPTAVMQALARICPRGGLILDPFCGAGTTGVGALLEGRRFLGIEITCEYDAIARERLDAAHRNVGLHEARAGQVGLFEVML